MRLKIAAVLAIGISAATAVLTWLGILPQDGWWAVLGFVVLAIASVLWVSTRRNARPLPVVPESEMLNDAHAAQILVRQEIGRLNLRDAADTNLLFTGSFVGGVEKQVKRENGTSKLELKSPVSIGPKLSARLRNTVKWDLQVNPTVPLSLKFEGGAATVQMDLARLHLERLALAPGASATDIVLPVPHGTLGVTIHPDAATMTLRLPPDVPARVQYPPRREINVTVPHLPLCARGHYESAGYGSAADRIDIKIGAGNGAVEIRDAD